MKTYFGSRAIIALLLGALALFGTVAFAINATPIGKPDVLADVTFASTFSDADTRYLQTSLEWLRDYLREWYAYVADAKPLNFGFDETQRARGIISYAKCCYTRGTGAITFGAPLGQWNLYAMPTIPGIQAQQVQFLSVLVHEVTHIRDARDGRIGQLTNSSVCIAAEKSANEKELEFARALTRVQISGDATARANYHALVDKHLDITQKNVDSVLWTIVCMLTFMDEEGK
jgi:hypothetical protein